MSKQTAVEWLLWQLPTINTTDPWYSRIIEQAKQMEKQQIVDAYIEGDCTSIEPEVEYKSLVIKDAEQYYQETFKQ
jgi:hypothetical protein